MLYTFIGCNGGKQLLYYIIGLKLANTSHSKNMLFFSFGWFVTQPTLNILPWKKEKHLQATNFGVPAVSFRGGVPASYVTKFLGHSTVGPCGPQAVLIERMFLTTPSLASIGCSLPTIPYHPCMVYLPTFTIKNQPKVGKYAVRPMDGTGTTKWSPPIWAINTTSDKSTWNLKKLTQSWDPRNLQRADPSWTDPEKTWVSNSSIATYWR